jgi:hypothetical protein
MSDLDNLVEAGARDLAERIAKYWAGQGHLVSTWIEPFSTDPKNGGDRRWAVRSGLVGGLPSAKIVPIKSHGNGSIARHS